LGIDTNVVMDALFGKESSARKLIEAGRDRVVELALSKTFDDEFKPRVGRSGIDPTKDELWKTIASLPRLSRPGAVIGYARIGEMRVGDDGAFGAVHGKQSGTERDKSIRDEEHVASAFDEAWAAVAFVTREKRLLESDALRKRGWRIVTPEEVLEQLAK
jgi:predicted nucleic acid-binding protein